MSNSNGSHAPPQNIDAEMSVLGAMLISQGAIAAASEALSENGQEFYRPSHALIWRSCLSLYAHGQPVDEITVSEKLTERGEIEPAGGKDYVHTLASLVPATANAGHHARVIKDCWLLRGLIRAGTEIGSMGWERPGETPDLIDRAQQIVFDLSEKEVRGDLIAVADPVKNAYQAMTEAQARGGVIGLPTGFRQLDRIICGLTEGSLLILAARPGMGKSALAHAIAMQVGVSGEPVAVFSLEMSEREVMFRFIAAKAMLSLTDVRSGQLTSDEWARALNATSEIAESPIHIDDSAGLGLLEMRSKARRMKTKGGLSLVVVDYLQLMRAEGRDIYERVSSISKGLKILARDLEVPVLAVAQLNREVEKRHNHRPQLSDLRDSGQLEQDADVVLFLYREGYYDEEADAESEIVVGKQRNGPTGTAKAVWIGKSATFGEAA